VALPPPYYATGIEASAPLRDDPPAYPSVDPFADFPSTRTSQLPSIQSGTGQHPASLPPSYDRSAKPGSGVGASSAHASDTSSDIPFIPDRSMKPVFGHDVGHRPVIVPTKLITRFLELAKHNSDRDIETLGMLGGKLSKNKFTVTHLLIPKQTGKSDRCDLQGHEDLGDAYDSEDIILVGWIHTHPAYDVFLSSVDMHNQYEYQNMLSEFVAIVCSIKFNETGYLTLTDAGMEDIGKCTQENFHPHSKTPPLFGPAAHVIQDQYLEIKVMDLR
jgi:STAM-binding protein